tara:strand:+ start:141 stop:611 length:471 start_codon:yes stop_codon:yes gene_type:complete
MLEVFKQVEDFPDYAISNFGRVYSIPRTTIDGRKCGGKYLTLSPNNEQYLNVTMKKSQKVHRLVAEAFIPNPLNLPCVDHIDRDRTNNQLNNLRWVTKLMNGQNRSFSKSNKTGISNISYDNHYKHYRFEKIINRERHTRFFKTFEEAIIYKKSFT